MLEERIERNLLATITCPLCGLSWWTPATKPKANKVAQLGTAYITYEHWGPYAGAGVGRIEIVILQTLKGDFATLSNVDIQISNKLPSRANGFPKTQ